MTRLLVTGFGPFPRVPRNPSERLARALAAHPRLRLRGIEAEALILRTAYGAVDAALVPHLRERRPDAVLMLGVAARRRHVSVETRAVNRVSRLFPDAGGRVASRLAFRPGGPHLRRARAPLAGLIRALRGSGLDAHASRDAGRYLCNASSYAALETGAAPTVFVHIPLPRSHARRDRRPTLRAMERGLLDVALILAAEGRRAALARGLSRNGGLLTPSC
ncbi:peptidase C15 [Salinarimonas soli]|uniref:Pyrrolidone-carboxylate peptidase n=1 Tax=Salinarimonas soli TaxID=1638099 RepID=A0A5B2VFG3_9HYPH|nr:peptidase C15 [Salinarimonas soli]KAA2237346.1 peptidase C15 [Salinarimonas soli]